jgi:hypothetical protein
MIPLFLIGKSDQPFSVPITYRTVEYLIVANNSSQTHSYNEHEKHKCTDLVKSRKQPNHFYLEKLSYLLFSDSSYEFFDSKIKLLKSLCKLCVAIKFCFILMFALIGNWSTTCIIKQSK